MSAGQIHFVHGDIRDTELVERLLQEEALDMVVHFAAESHVDRSIHGPEVFLSTNVRGTMSLLEACRSVWLDKGDVPHRFHHVSTVNRSYQRLSSCAYRTVNALLTR